MMLTRRIINVLPNYAKKNVSAIRFKGLINHPLTGGSMVAWSSLNKVFSGTTDISQKTPKLNLMAHTSYMSNSRDRICMKSLEDVVLENVHSMEADEYITLVRDTLSVLVKKIWGFHYRGVTLGNMKPQNVLIHNGECSLVSFVNDGNESQSWKAPEQFHCTTLTTKASDMFSIGCVLYFCITGCHPFGDDPIQRIKSILGNEVNLSQVEDIPEAFDLLSRLLLPLPKSRIKINEVASHPFFRQHYWKTCFLKNVCHSLNCNFITEVTSTIPMLADPIWRNSFYYSAHTLMVMQIKVGLKAYGSPCFRGSLSRTVQRIYKHHKNDEWFEDYIYPEDAILEFEDPGNN